MTVTLAPVQITAPGVYDGMSDDIYHGDPVPGGSLSSSGARKLLPPSCPALFRYERDHGQAPRAEFDFGKAAHLMVLDAGPEIAVVDADDWRTKAAKEQRDEAYAAGKVPLLKCEHRRVVEMAVAINEHPIAGRLFHHAHGKPEQSLFWTDADTDVWMRGRLDWLPNQGEGRLIVPDYKTCRSANPEHLRRAIADYGYHQQAAWYLDGIEALGIAEEAAFIFVCQEKTAPYLVTVVELDAQALRVGRVLNRRATEIYRDCVAADVWPGYSDDVELISLPAWAARLDEESW